MLFFISPPLFLPPDLNHPPASAPQSHLQGRERGREGEGAGRARVCALMWGDSVPVRWQESLASPARPLTLRRRPGADLWRGEGTGDTDRMTMRRLGHRLTAATDLVMEGRRGKTGQDRAGSQARSCGLKTREGG